MAGGVADRICDLPGAGLTPACQIREGAQAVGAVIDAASDPLGYLAQALQAAALGLSEVVLPALETLTHPDLSAEWFVSAYSVSFALSIFVWVAFLGWNFLGLSRRRFSGDDVVESMAYYTPLFLGGVIFGPIVGNAILGLTGALTDSIISWGVAGSVGETTTALNAAIEAGDPAQMVGGAAVAIILFACLIVALLLVFVVLLVMLVTLYLTGVLIPLSLVWLVHPGQRSKGLKLLMVWIGICFSHVLLFLLLGVAFRMVGGLATEWDEPGLTVLANLGVAVIALLLATLSPVALLKFAPIGPGGASTSGPSLSVPGRGASAGTSYPESSSDSQLGQMSRDSSSSAEAGEADGGDSSTSTSTSSAGGLAGRLDEQKAGQAASTSSMEAAGGGEGASVAGGAGEAAAGAGSTAGSAAGVGAGSAAAAGASAAAPGVGAALAAAGSDGAGPGGSGGTGSTGADPIGSTATASGDAAEAADTGAPAEGSGSATAGLAAAGAQAEDSGDKATQAGSLAMASGAGAPVGVALMAAGQGIKAAGAAVTTTAQAAQSAGDLAGEQMDHGAEDGSADRED